MNDSKCLVGHSNLETQKFDVAAMPVQLRLGPANWQDKLRDEGFYFHSITIPWFESLHSPFALSSFCQRVLREFGGANLQVEVYKRVGTEVEHLSAKVPSGHYRVGTRTRDVTCFVHAAVISLEHVRVTRLVDYEHTSHPGPWVYTWERDYRSSL